MSNTYVDTNPINLKERIAALEHRSITPTPEAHQPKPSGIPQLSNNVHLRDKIAKFERKGGVPVPRGRFGMGAPPANSGKPKKQGELYGNRIPRLASASAPRPAPGVQTNRRSVSLSGSAGDAQDYGASMPRSISPCPSDSTNSEAPLSPDAEKEYFSQEMDSPSTPPTEVTEGYEDSPMKLNSDFKDASEDTLLIPPESNNQGAVQDDASTGPDIEAQEVVTESAFLQSEDANAVPEIVPQVITTGLALNQPGQVSEGSPDSTALLELQVEEKVALADDTTDSDKAEEIEVERLPLNEEVVPPTEPEKKPEDESVDINSEIANVVEETSSNTLSRSSSLRTLKPIYHATTSTPPANEETIIVPEVPVISLSPPPSAGDVVSSAVSSPLELYSPQGSERGASNTSSGDSSPIASSACAASSASSPVEVESPSISPVEPTTRIPSLSFTRSPSTKELPDTVIPVHEDNVIDSLTRTSRKGTLSKVTIVEAASLSSTEETSTPTVTVTSPPVLNVPELAPVTLLHGLSDKQASSSSPSALSPLSISDMLSLTSDSPSATQSTFSSSTEKTVSDRKVMATAERSISASPSLTNATEESNSADSPATMSPTSFRSPANNSLAVNARKVRPSSFHAVVHSKVRETAPATQTPAGTSQLLAVHKPPQVKKVMQSGRIENLASPGTGELVSLLHEATLLENALTEGGLDLSLNVGGQAAQEENPRLEQPQGDKEDRQEDPRGIVHEPSAPKGEGSNLSNLKSRLAFRLPLKKKTKYWKVSSTANPILQEEMRLGHSLDTERIAGLSTSDPTFLKYDPAAAMKTAQTEVQPNTPKSSEGFRQDSQYKTPPKSPRLLASFRKLTSSGSTKSLHSSQPRRSGSTWSLLSSDDSAPVLTPPDASLYFATSASKDGMSSSQSYRSTQSHGSNIAWPSMSPKRTLARAASFAEKILNRARTMSSGSTLSAQGPRGGGSLSTPSRKAASSVNLTTTAPSSFRLDLSSLTPSGSLFDSPLGVDSPSFSMSNLHSPSPSAHASQAGGSASTSALPNRHSPGVLTDNESWISEASPLDPSLFDAFPSVPEQPVPTLPHRSGPPRKATQQHLPTINVESSLSSYDSFFTNSPTLRSAELLKRNHQ